MQSLWDILIHILQPPSVHCFSKGLLWNMIHDTFHRSHNFLKARKRVFRVFHLIYESLQTKYFVENMRARWEQVKLIVDSVPVVVI